MPNSSHPPLLPPPSFLKGGIDLTKNPKKGEGDGKIFERQGDPKKEGILQERRDAVSLGIFSSWGVANVHLGHSVPISIECRCQSLFPLYIVTLCCQGKVVIQKHDGRF